MFEYLLLPVFRRAILALVLSGIALPSMGTYILSLELVPARFAVMHASLLGAAIGLALGVDPTAAALAAALACGLAVWLMSRAPTGDSAGGPLALVMTLCVALAFVIFHKSGVRAMDAFSLFWGNILALRESDLRLTAAFAAVVLGFSLALLKEIRAVLFDRELARSAGMPADAIHAALIVLVCLGVGMAMRLTGALLADALTVLPALAARRLGKNLGSTLLWGGCLGLAMNAGGFALALAFDLPAGPAIILVGAALVGASALLPRPH